MWGIVIPPTSVIIFTKKRFGRNFGTLVSILIHIVEFVFGLRSPPSEGVQDLRFNGNISGFYAVLWDIIAIFLKKCTGVIHPAQYKPNVNFFSRTSV